MTQPDDDREQRLFEAALELEGQERDAYLERELAGDPEGLARIRRLLAVDEASRVPLDAPAAEQLAGAAEVPESIGPYRIHGVLGSGGMGVVYEAEQQQPKRRVALKVLRPGLVTENLLRRFEHEVQVLGWLAHPGIAQIHEAGTADTGFGLQPYFAMELVRGEPLLAHCERKRLDAGARLRLLAQVCDAVQHAHQKGVIHRDLKPANILLGRAGEVQIADFGIAKATVNISSTRQG